MATVGDHVTESINFWDQAKLDLCILHACLAVDGTARKLRPGVKDNRRRFVGFLRENYWIIEPASMPGFDLVQTRFENVPLRSNPAPDWAEVIYEVFRCSHVHVDGVPAGFSLTPGVGLALKTGRIGDGVLEMPDNLPFGLLFAVVLSPVNSEERVPDGYYLSLGHADLHNWMQFPINDWWGAGNDFRPIALRHNKVRVHFVLGDSAASGGQGRP